METKDKMLILIVVAWIVAAVYFKVTTDKLFGRIDEMEQQQLRHVEQVNHEFREDLRTLNLQFIGRGKHLREAQNNILANKQLINHVADSLSRNIEIIQLNLEDLSRATDGRFTQVEQNAARIEDRFNSFRRRTERGLNDLDQRLGTAEKDIVDLNERVPPKKKD